MQSATDILDLKSDDYNYSNKILTIILKLFLPSFFIYIFYNVSYWFWLLVLCSCALVLAGFPQSVLVAPLVQHRLFYRLPLPQTGSHPGLSGPSSGRNTAGSCKDQHKLLSQTCKHRQWWEGTKRTQWSQRGSVATRHRTGRGSLSWSAPLLGTGRCRGRCPPGNTNSQCKQLRQIRHLME